MRPGNGEQPAHPLRIHQQSGNEEAMAMTRSIKTTGIKYAFYTMLLAVMMVLAYTVPPPVGV